ncbi:type IV secretion system protein [Nocardiopsis suaedae]|uniref:Type IV secretion system protein n=1 Tax=Nocardiopsis suaedae TaxID=3018444 RepID=A0ABT4TEU2_9ACTN|nr:type IV secretion system protein [Nocardiopsis suaedae]MDA2803223.1 type IV secretion system protein [Nocardiopsis suaedae]
MALLVMAFLLVPLGAAQAAPLCPGEPAPQPESAGSGSDGLLVPPQSQSSIVGSEDGLPPDASIYGQYGTAGQQWHVIRESCVDKMSSSAMATLSNTTWSLSKTINQSTITVYQAATSDGLLNDFNTMVTGVITQLREGIWRPLLPTVIILGAVWLGWYGLVRKRVTLTVESTIWMVLATALGLWILVQPQQILNMAGGVVNSGTQLVNSAVSRVSVGGGSTSCPAGAEPVQQAEWESDSDFAVRQNSNMLWSSLVCQPWVAGTFGSGDVAESATSRYAVDLLEAQGISRVEQQQIADGEVDAEELIADKEGQYEDIASEIQETYPGVYPLFAGDQQGDRLGVAVLALFAAVFAGGLILAGSVALIVLKIGFLLLLLLAPVFLLIGVHPGYGRTVLLRWLEMMFGLLLKQIFVVMLIALLVMCYGIIMGSGLGWGLQMILLALFTLALFIYRKPFAHLFASVNANTFTSRMVSDAMQSRTLSQSANVLPPVAYMRAQKWGLKRAPQLAAAAGAVPASGVGAGGDQPDVGGRGSAQGAPEQAEGEGGAVRGEGRRVRGSAGYGRAHGKAGPPPLKLGSTEGKEPSASTPSAPPPKSADQAPSLGGVAAHSGGAGSGSRGRESGSGPIPPRPAGGYRGTGDTGWASVFGTGSGSGQRSGAGSDSRAAEPPSRGEPSPTSGTGIFKGREATPPQGNVNRGSRWGGPRSRRERPAPPRQSAPPASNGSKEGGHWFKSGDRDPDRPISPFWTGTGTGTGAQRRPDKDVPFWLKDGD